MPWYDGPPLLEHLESSEVAGERAREPRRVPVPGGGRPLGGAGRPGPASCYVVNLNPLAEAGRGPAADPGVRPTMRLITGRAR